MDADDATTTKRFRFRAMFTLGPTPWGNGCDRPVIRWDNSFPTKLNEYLLRNGEHRDNQEMPISLASYLTITSLNTQGQGYLRHLSVIDDASEDINFYEQIFLSALPPDSVQFTLTVNHSTGQFQVTGNNLNLKVTKFADSYGLDMWMDIPEKMGTKWREIWRMTNGLQVGLMLHLEDSAVGALYLGKAAMLKVFGGKVNGGRLFVKWSEMLLNEARSGRGSDIVFQIGDTNKTVKLNKLIFSGRSPAFEAMLKEVNYADIFGGMTEASVQALIKFILSRDLEAGWKSCEVAVALLIAGIKLGMGDLTDSIEQLICFMPFNWLSFEMATQLSDYLTRTGNAAGRLGEVEKKCLDYFEWFLSRDYNGRSWAPVSYPTVWDKTSSKVECCFLKKGRLVKFKRFSCTSSSYSYAKVQVVLNASFTKRRDSFWAELLRTRVNNKNKVDLKGDLRSNLKVCLHKDDQRNAVTLKVLMDEYKSSDVNLFEELAKSHFPPNCYGFNLTITGLVNVRGLLIDGKNLKVQKFEDGTFGLELTGVDVGEITCDPPNPVCDEFFATVTLSLVLGAEMANALNWIEFVTYGFKTWYGKLLDGIPIPTDFVIWAADSETTGEGVKCHKFILSERIPVLEKMLNSDMVECRNGCMKIEDMTEAGVKEMLGFVYGWDLKGAWEDCDVALELLRAGDKYGMEDLVEAMVEVVWAMPFEWFREDVAKEMVEFAGEVGGKLGKVEEKCSVVLKRFAANQTADAMDESTSKIADLALVDF